MTTQAFFLPIETRPKNFPPLTEMEGKFWHTGIIHDNKVYECFNFGKYSISDFDEVKKQNLINQEAIFLTVDIIDLNKLNSEIISGTSCAEYVARVVNLSKNTGAIKEYWPEQVYDFIINQNRLFQKQN